MTWPWYKKRPQPRADFCPALLRQLELAHERLVELTRRNRELTEQLARALHAASGLDGVPGPAEQPR